jgi:hypothetical protein
MKRVWGHVLAAAALLAGAGAVESACVHDNSTLYIQNVLAQQLVTNGQQCLFTPDPTQPFVSGGTLDVGFRNSYEAEFLVGNQTVPQGDPSAPKTETSRITLEGGIVRITNATTGEQLANYTTATSATVNPQSGSNPSFIATGLTIVDNATVMKLLPNLGPNSFVRVLTYTRIFGHTLGGQYVESDEFQFPIDICYGCLVNFSSQSINPNWKSPNCGGAISGASGGSAGSGGMTLPSPCLLGQDVHVDCSQCLAYPVCTPNMGSVPVPVADAGAG